MNIQFVRTKQKRVAFVIFDTGGEALASFYSQEPATLVASRLGLTYRMASMPAASAKSFMVDTENGEIVGVIYSRGAEYMVQGALESLYGGRAVRSRRP